MRNILNKAFLIFITQLMVLVACIFTYTATIEGVPWYEPLTMGPFMGIMMLLPIQGFLIFGIWVNRKKLNNNIIFVAISNLIFLILTVFISMINENFFYIISKIFPVIEVLLVLYSLMKAIGKRKNNMKEKKLSNG